MLDKLFRAHSEKNGLGEKNGGAAMNTFDEGLLASPRDARPAEGFKSARTP